MKQYFLSDWFQAPHETCKKAMGCMCTAQCKIVLFCAKTVMKESHNFELVGQKKKQRNKKKNILAVWWLSHCKNCFNQVWLLQLQLDASGDHCYMTCLQLWVTSTSTTTTMYCFHSAVYFQSLKSHDLMLAAVSQCEHHMQWHVLPTVTITIDGRVVFCFNSTCITVETTLLK